MDRTGRLIAGRIGYRGIEHESGITCWDARYLWLRVNLSSKHVRSVSKADAYKMSWSVSSGPRADMEGDLHLTNVLLN
jgi:hypothetical protein